MKKSPEKIAVMYLKNCHGYNVGNANYYLDDLIKICKAKTFRDIARSFLHDDEDFPPDWAKTLEYFFKAEAAVDTAVAFTKNFLERNLDVDPKFFYHTLRWGNRFKKMIYLQVAEIYDIGGNGVQADAQKALDYFRKVDEYGDFGYEWIFFRIVKTYREGKGNVKPDGYKLIEYLMQKLEQENDFAKDFPEIILFHIAKTYEEGCGALQADMSKVLEFYREAAALGSDDAKAKLAGLTEIF